MRRRESGSSSGELFFQVIFAICVLSDSMSVLLDSVCVRSTDVAKFSSVTVMWFLLAICSLFILSVVV